jgi:phosphoribosylformylglycinamidine synthase subunit PurQ / glutaminase
MNIAVLQFPGSNCDQDAVNAFGRVLGLPTRLVWHKETSFGEADLVVVPGGFSFGDYLRCGAIARFSPVVRALREHAQRGGLVLGICNGFQILCEAGLLPGALIRNRALEFRCETALLSVENASASFNRERLGDLVRLPIAHGEGNYRIDAEGLERLEKNGQVLLRYCDAAGGIAPEASVNGSMNNIAGIRNEAGNVFGMMPHPERAVERFHPSRDGLKVLQAILEQRSVAAGS